MVRVLQVDVVTTDIILPTNLQLRDRALRTESLLDSDWSPVPRGHVPYVQLGTRVHVDESGVPCLEVLSLEPRVERAGRTILVHRRQRTLKFLDDPAPLWHVLRLSDTERTVEQVMAAVPEESRGLAEETLARLVEAGAFGASAIPFTGVAHALSKRPTLRPPGLSADAVERLAAEGAYRRHEQAPRLDLTATAPPELRPLADLFQRRRSYSRYNGRAIERAELEALLTSACGVTGSLRLAPGTVRLRAYPSPGGLYAVEIYVMALEVRGLERGVYHHRPTERALFRLRDGRDLRVADLALPDVASVVSGAAVFIALTASFGRPERKYGLGAYRALASEAGCLAENLLLAATAIGLHAGPFTGVYDDLVHQTLGLDGEGEQFLLGVLVGHSDGEK